MMMIICSFVKIITTHNIFIRPDLRPFRDVNNTYI